MCGLAGFLQANGLGSDPACELAAHMGERIAHRGPNDGGVWADADAGFALAHRRLSILDLSPQGHQSMVSRCGRYVIAFNGEYNFAAIRDELEQTGVAPAWRGHSDTEVMLVAIAAWGAGGGAEAIRRHEDFYEGLLANAR